MRLKIAAVSLLLLEHKPTLGFVPASVSTSSSSPTCSFVNSIHFHSNDDMAKAATNRHRIILASSSTREKLTLDDLDAWLLDDSFDNFMDDEDGTKLEQPESAVPRTLTAVASALEDFITLLSTTPPGSLETEQISLIRSTMIEASEETGDASSVERLLFRMIQEFKVTNPQTCLEMLVPTDQDFQRAMITWQQHSGGDSSNLPSIINNLFNEQESLYESGVDECKPSMETVKLVMSTLCYSRDRGSDRRVYAMYEQLSDWGLEPDSEILGYVVQAVAKSRQYGAAERAQSLVKEAFETYNLLPPVEAFNAIVTAWAKSGLEDGPDRAERVLMYMENVGVTPTIMSFTSLIDAYCQTNTWDGVSQGERILNRLLEEYLQDNTSPEPTVASWTIVISGWTRLAKNSNSGAPPRADTLLKRMEDLQGRISCKPDAITYKKVMQAWIGAKINTERAEELLDEMYERYLDGDDDMKPTPWSVKAVVDAWVKTNTLKGMNQAEGLLSRLQDIEEMQQPSDEVRDIYKNMIFGWTKMEDPFRAYQYLEEMIERGLAPDAFCFDRIIEASTLAGGEREFQLTYRVMETMEVLRKEGVYRPNERVYTSFIRALSKRVVPDCAKKCIMVLQKMKLLAESDKNRGMAPTVFTYNAVLFACSVSKVEGDDAANMETFKLAIGMFNELRALEREEADHMTYGNMLRCGALLPEGNQRNAVLTSTFQLACREGFVNQYVTRDLQFSASEELWRALTLCPVGDVDWEKLPFDWKRRFEKKEKKPEFSRAGRDGGRGGGREGGRGSGRGGGRGGDRGGGRGGGRGRGVRSEGRY